MRQSRADSGFFASLLPWESSRGCCTVAWGAVNDRSESVRRCVGLELPLPPAGTVLHIRVIGALVRAENVALRFGCRRALKLLDVNGGQPVLRLGVVRAVVIGGRRVDVIGVIRIILIPKRRSDEEPASKARAVMVVESAPCAARMCAPSMAAARMCATPMATARMCATPMAAAALTGPSPVRRCKNS